MDRSRQMVVLLSVVVLLTVVLIGLTIFLMSQIKRCDEKQALIDEQSQTIEAIQDEGILELIAYTKSVMGAEIIISDQNSPFWPYSYSETTHPKMKTTEVKFKVISAKIDEDNAKLVFSYNYKYFDENGETIMFNSASETRPTTWWLERQDGAWVIVDKHSYL